MVLIATKIILSIAIVFGLLFISERNPKVGGLIAGLPLGTGVLIFFYSIEQGIHFVIQGIPYGIAGLSSSLAFVVGFYFGGKLCVHRPFLHVTAAVLSGLVTFFAVSYSLSLFKINLLSSIFIFMVGVMLAIRFFRHVSIGKKSVPKLLTRSTVLFRSLFVTIVVLSITGVANVIGAKWAGMMASFPTVLCPLIMILAFSYKNDIYPTVLKHFSYSITTLAVFYLLVLFLFPIMGVYYGTFVSYSVCLGYVYGLSNIRKIMGKFSRVAKLFI